MSARPFNSRLRSCAKNLVSVCFVSVRSDGVNRSNAGWYRLNMTVPQVWGDQPQINLLTRATPSDKKNRRSKAVGHRHRLRLLCPSHGNYLGVTPISQRGFVGSRYPLALARVGHGPCAILSQRTPRCYRNILILGVSPARMVRLLPARSCPSPGSSRRG